MPALAELIAQTLAELGPLVQKPKLTEQLLSKPPFRFIHDVVTALTASTGFAEGLFSGSELDPHAISERAAKMAYLDKIIDFVGNVNGEPVDVRSSKIVAGQEPENSNLFFIALARAVRKKQAGGATALMPAGGAGSASGRSAGGSAPSAGPPPFRSAAELGANGDVARTQALLQPLFAKPVLTERLLSKPPFRFLHDIFTALLASTRFATGLLTDAQLNPDNVTDKEGKMAVLDRYIDAIGVHLNTHVSARSSKIVAGSEPERTNEMLQLLAMAATDGRSSDAAVRAVLAGAKQLGADGAPQAGAAAPAPAAAVAAPQQLSVATAAPAPDARAFAGPAAAAGGGPAAAAARTPRGTDASAAGVAAGAGAGSGAGSAAGGFGGDSSASAAAAQGGSQQQQRFIRPKTAQRRPPKIKEPTASAGPAQGGAGGAAGAAGAIPLSLMAEGAGGDDDDDDDVWGGKRGDGAASAGRSALGGTGGSAFGGGFGTGAGMGMGGFEDPFSLGLGSGGAGGMNLKGNAGRTPMASGGAGGGLGLMGAGGKHTRDILSDAGAGGGVGAEGEGDGSGGIRMGRIVRAGAGAAGGAVGAGGGLAPEQLEALRGGIQALCANTQPLTRSLDFIGEDVEDMRGELRAWAAEFKKRGEVLAREMAETDEAVEPLLKELGRLDERAREVMQRIAQTKASVAGNDARIQELIRQVVIR